MGDATQSKRDLFHGDAANYSGFGSTSWESAIGIALTANLCCFLLVACFYQEAEAR